MKITKGIAVALTAAILASGGGVATSLATAIPAQAASTQSDINTAITQILNETNAERANAGLAPLTLNADINVVSQNWTESMAAQDSMYHNPDYQFQMPQPWIRVGENVGQGYTTSTIVAAWMASPGHRANILGDFTHIGIGYWVDETGRAWFTQNFGKYDVPVFTQVSEPVTTAGKFDFTSTWDINWAENVQEYKAELYSSEGVLLETKIIPFPNASVTFDGLTDLTTYNVSLVAQSTNTLGEYFSSPPRTYSVTTLEDVPTVTAPTDLALVPGEDSMAVYWNAPAESNGALQPYSLELLKAGVVVDTAQTTDRNYTFTGLSSNTDYTVNVTAITAVRAKTATANATVSSTTLLSSVANVSEPTNVAVVSESFDTLTATWNAPASQTGVNLKYTATLSTADEPDVTVVTTNPTYTFSGLKQNTDYTVKVQASITSENGANTSTTAGVLVDVRTLADQNAVEVTAPTLKPVDVQAKYASLNWDAPSTLVGNLTNYTVTVKQAGQADREYNTTNTFFVVPDLIENTTYSFEVKANAASLNGANTASASSAVLSGKTPYAPDTVIVTAPTAVAVALPNPTEVNVTWEAPANVVGTLAGYNVVLKSGDTVVETANVTGLTANFTGLTSDTNYTVEVTALASSADATANAVSSASSVQFNTAGVEVTAPSEVQISEVTYDSLKTTWTAPSVVVGTLTKYGVVVKQNGSVLGSYFTNNNYYTLTGLKSNTAYTIEVQAYVSSFDGLSEEVSPVTSNTVMTQKSPLVSVAAPTASVSDVSADRFTVTWTRPAANGLVTAYNVVVKQGNNVVRTIPTSMLTTSTVVTGLAAETAYTVTVEATAISEDNTNTATTASAVANVTTSAAVVAPVVPPTTTTPPVDVPTGTEAPADNNSIQLDVSGTTNQTSEETATDTTSGDPVTVTSEEADANLANTGVFKTAPLVAGTGLALLLAAFALLFAGRIRLARKN